MLPSLGTAFAPLSDMTRASLTDRVTALERKVGSKTIEEQFREQAELIDRLFLQRDNKWDLRFVALEKDVRVLKTDVSGLRTDVRVLKTDVSGLKTDVSGLRKDMVIVREGIDVILKKLDAR